MCGLGAPVVVVGAAVGAAGVVAWGITEPPPLPTDAAAGIGEVVVTATARVDVRLEEGTAESLGLASAEGSSLGTPA